MLQNSLLQNVEALKLAFPPSGNVAGSPGTEYQRIAQVQRIKRENVCPCKATYAYVEQRLCYENAE